jgi:hypothetical protein
VNGEHAITKLVQVWLRMLLNFLSQGHAA